MKSLAQRLGRLIVALAVALAPSVAAAKPSSTADREVRKVSSRAEQMLDKLEYERARELLEVSVRRKRYGRAKPSSKARLWALLGRARAELGDAVGSDEAFLEAVRWDRRVKLSRSTSPKIREALERARRNAPPPAPPPPPLAVAPPPKAPPPKAPPPKAPPPKAPPPKRVDRRPPPPPRTKRPARTKRPRATASGRKGAWVEARVVGRIAPGAKAELVAEHGGLPRRARIEARVKSSQSGPFETVRMTRSGTVARATLVLDSPRIEVFVVARRGRRVLAQSGSETEPMIITPVSSAPTLAEAWSENPPPPAAPPPPLADGATQTQTTTVAGLPPPGPPPPAVVPPPPTSNSSSELGATEITLLAVGGAVVVAAVVTAVLLLATRTNNCDVAEGQGCVEVQVAPSSLVRF